MVIWVKRFYGMHVIVPTLVISLLVFWGVSLMTRKPQERIIQVFWGK